MSMKKRGFVFCALALATCAGRLSTASAGFDVTFWSLNTGVSEGFGGAGETINAIQNPFLYTSLSSVGDNNQNRVRAAYDYGWNVSSGAGIFHNDLEQHIFGTDVRTLAISVIDILSDIPLHVRLTGSLTYSHTPSQLSSFLFGASVRDLSINQVVLSDFNEGGHLNFHPSSGTLTMAGEVILQPGISYQLEYAYNAHNYWDPFAILDSSGFVRWEINPVPSPATFMLLLPASLMLLRRSRRA